MLDNVRAIHKGIEALVANRVNRVYTLGLGVVKTLKRTAEGVVYQADVQPKWDPSAAVITDAPVIHSRGSTGFVLVPIKEGDVVLCLFSYSSIQGLLKDKESRIPPSPRLHSYADCLVFAGSPFVEDERTDLGVPAGYSNLDLLILQKPGYGVWGKENGDLVLGNLEGTLKNVVVQGDSGSGVGDGPINTTQNQKVKLGI